MRNYRIDSSAATLPIPSKLWVGLAVLLLCSCRSMTKDSVSPQPEFGSRATAAIENNSGPSEANGATRFRLEDESAPQTRHQGQAPYPDQRLDQTRYQDQIPPQTQTQTQYPQRHVRHVSHEEPNGSSSSVMTATGAFPRRARCCPACGVENCQQHLCLPDSAIYLPLAQRPKDEYLCDGGDRELDVRLGRDGIYQGLDMEDTVASYRTKSGEIKVEASNKVCIYAPRFASVRKITGITVHQQHLVASTMRENLGLISEQQNLKSDFVRQRDELSTGRKLLAANDFRSHAGTEVSDDIVMLGAVQRQLLPYENFNMIRAGVTDESEKPKLARRVLAAFTWAGDEGIKVAANGVQLQEAVNGSAANDFVVYEIPKGKPKLRIAKLASTDNALPGDTVDFTIRFDNLGDETLKEVAVVDNLTPRLELIPDSVSCSVEAEFHTSVNEGESLTLRWTLAEPLEINKGGVIHFRCKVR